MVYVNQNTWADEFIAFCGYRNSNAEKLAMCELK